MRLRKIANAQSGIDESIYTIIEPIKEKGHWKEVFSNDNPIRVEIGMGKGDFIIGMAKLFPNINFIGIEQFSSVLIRAIEKIKEEEILNLKLIRFDANNIAEIFEDNEIDTIYLNFSDPWPKQKHSKRRLTSNKFIKQYKKILNKNGMIIQKTDNEKLFDFSNASFKEEGFICLEKTYDLHNSEYDNWVITEYEKKFTRANITIKYAKYKKVRDEEL